MKIKILYSLVKDGKKPIRFRPDKDGESVEYPGLLDLVNQYVDRVLIQVGLEGEDAENPPEEPCEEPLEVGVTFDYYGNMLRFETGDKLCLDLNHTGKACLDRFVQDLYREIARTKQGKLVGMAPVSWYFAEKMPLGFKEVTLLNFKEYQTLCRDVSKENFWREKNLLKFVVGGFEIYVKGQKAYIDPEDDLAADFFESTAKTRLITWIKNNNKELTPKPAEQPAEEEQTENN